METEEFKEKVRNILGENIKFDGHVSLIIDNLTGNKQRLILEWINNCKLGKIKPEPCKNFKSLISFIYKSNDNRIRGILTK